MIKALEHLPQEKQDQLEIIKDIILEKIPDVRTIILFGSYARGNWVEDTHTEGYTTHVYESDFDILVATKTAKQAESFNLHDIVIKAIEATEKITTPLSIIYHSFGEVNKRITEGHYFFADIKKEGIQLYRKKSKHSLAKIKILLPEERKQIAQKHFNQWFESASNFYFGYECHLKESHYKEAAFNLHQATERFYGAITLVFVNYRFRTHDLVKLGRKAVNYNAEFASVFPRDTDEQKEMFNLLKRAYVDARYEPDYEITKDQLEYLAERVRLLQELTEKICKAKINSFI